VSPGLRRWGAWGLRLALVAGVAVVVVRVGADNVSSLRHIHLRVRPVWFALAAPASVAGGLLLPVGWRSLLAAYGSALPLGRALRVWWLAQISRYVPTGAAALATRVVLAGREGVPRFLAGWSLPVEVGVIVAWGSVLTGALLPSSVLAAWARALVAAGGVLILVALPAGLRIAAALVPRLPAPLRGPEGTVPTYRAAAWYGLNSVVRSGAFVALAAALLPVHLGDVGPLVGAFNAAAVAGLVSIAPGGLGVREGVLALTLSSRYGFGNAAALSVALRLWDLLVDLAWVGIGLLASRRAPASSSAGAAADATEPEKMDACPVCAAPAPDLEALAAHLVERAEASDGRHVMWLNRRVTKHRVSAEELAPLLAGALSGRTVGSQRVRR